MFRQNSYVAVHSESEPFWLAICLENISHNASSSKKIRWLERSAINEQGTIYRYGGADKIFAHNIICEAQLITLSRFKCCLRLSAEQKILDQINSSEPEPLEHNEDLFCEENIKNDQPENVVVMNNGIPVKQINKHVPISLDSRDNFDALAFKNYDVSTINNLKNFNEFASISSEPCILLNDEQKAVLFKQTKSNSRNTINILSNILMDVTNTKNEKSPDSSQINRIDEIEYSISPDFNRESDPDYKIDNSKSSLSFGSSSNNSGCANTSTESIVTKNRKPIRVDTKRHACYFCNKLVLKPTRHLELVHKSEPEVAQISILGKKSKERKGKFSCLLRAGDYYHNCNVLTTGVGSLILTRQPRIPKLRSNKDYGPCPNCLGFFQVDSLWRHTKSRCPSKLPGSCMRRDIRGESCALLSSWFNDIGSAEYNKNILLCLKKDDIADVCKEDSTIKRFGSLLFERYTRQQYDHIRQSMRQLGRLLIQIKKIEKSINSLADALLPINFDALIKAVKLLCCASYENSQNFKIPSLALKLGHSLRKCAQIERGVALRKGDTKREQLMTGFLQLMDIDWQNNVSSSALRTITERKMNCAQLLPLTEDAVKLARYLEAVIQISLFNLKEQVDIQESWFKLAGAVLTRLILFNKRRSGEASRLTLQQYACRPNWSDQSSSELKATLTPLELKLAERLTIVEVKGKSRKNPKVPILLTPEIKEAIDVLIRTRSSVEINPENIYVFARGSMSINSLRGSDTLRKFSKDADLEKPELLTSTKLRKYIATVIQIFNLNDNETDWLARHMGHDIRIHREHYRLHESVTELTKVSRLLLAVDSGQASKYSGKTLADITLDEVSAPEDNSNVSNDEHEIETGSKNGFGNSATSFRNNSTEIALPNTSAEIPIVNSSKRSAQEKKAWTVEEKTAVLQYFSKHIKKGSIPKKHEVETLKEMKLELSNRRWTDIKYFVKYFVKLYIFTCMYEYLLV